MKWASGNVHFSPVVEPEAAELAQLLRDREARAEELIAREMGELQRMQRLESELYELAAAEAEAGQ